VTITSPLGPMAMSPKLPLSDRGACWMRSNFSPPTSLIAPRPITFAPDATIVSSRLNVTHTALGPVTIVGWSTWPSKVATVRKERPRSVLSETKTVSSPRLMNVAQRLPKSSKATLGSQQEAGRTPCGSLSTSSASRLPDVQDTPPSSLRAPISPRSESARRNGAGSATPSESASTSSSGPVRASFTDAMKMLAGLVRSIATEASFWFSRMRVVLTAGPTESVTGAPTAHSTRRSSGSAEDGNPPATDRRRRLAG
jgi:hypothetical protein